MVAHSKVGTKHIHLNLCLGVWRKEGTDQTSVALRLSLSFRICPAPDLFSCVFQRDFSRSCWSPCSDFTTPCAHWAYRRKNTFSCKPCLCFLQVMVVLQQFIPVLARTKSIINQPCKCLSPTNSVHLYPVQNKNAFSDFPQGEVASN